MNKLYIACGTISVVVGCLLGYFFYITSSPKETIGKTVISEQKPVDSSTEGDCQAVAEKEYIEYVKSHGTSRKDSYNNTIYDLSSSEWDKINTKRANQIDVCFHKFNG